MRDFKGFPLPRKHQESQATLQQQAALMRVAEMARVLSGQMETRLTALKNGTDNSWEAFCVLHGQIAVVLLGREKYASKPHSGTPRCFLKPDKK